MKKLDNVSQCRSNGSQPSLSHVGTTSSTVLDQQQNPLKQNSIPHSRNEIEAIPVTRLINRLIRKLPIIVMKLQ